MEKVIILKEVKKSDCSFLYELLSERKSHVNISHKKTPTYAKHVKFVMSKPYSKWYVIYHTTEKIGSVYLTKQDEIGIHFKEQNMNNKIRSKVLNMIIKITVTSNSFEGGTIIKKYFSSKQKFREYSFRNFLGKNEFSR